MAVSVVTLPGFTSRGAEVKDSSRDSLRSLSAALRPFWRYSECPEEQQSVTGLWELRPISWRAGGDHRHTAAGVVSTQQFPDDCTLAPAAKALMGITFVQVMLGMGAFITRMMAEEASPAVVVPSVAHVAAGSLSLGATVFLALEIGRHLAPRREGLTTADELDDFDFGAGAEHRFAPQRLLHDAPVELHGDPGRVELELLEKAQNGQTFEGHPRLAVHGYCNGHSVG